MQFHHVPQNWWKKYEQREMLLYNRNESRYTCAVVREGSQMQLNNEGANYKDGSSGVAEIMYSPEGQNTSVQCAWG